MSMRTRPILYFVFGASLTVFLLMIYGGQLAQIRGFQMSSQLIPPKMFSPIEMSTPSPSGIVKKDLPVLFKTEMNEDGLDNVTSVRKSPASWQAMSKMTVNRVNDDYRFCARVAPFVGPFPFVNTSQNPCWYMDGKLHCIPHFYLAGFSKSGTSDLFRRIAGHPDIVVDSKEKHWLDYLRYFENGEKIESYTSRFTRFTRIVDNEIAENGSSNALIGDGTPCYVWHSLYWHCYEGNTGLTEPKYTNADVLYRMNPKAKIILSLRDPVTRLYSRYLTWVNKLKHPDYRNPTPYNFHRICVRAIKLYNSCFKEWSTRHCAYNGTLYSQVKLRLQEGMYSIFIRDWLNVFPREQIFIMKFEDYVKDEIGYLKKIYNFLEVESLDSENMTRISKLKMANVGKHYNIGPLHNRTRELLQRFYSPYNKDLQNLMKDPSWSWGYE